MITLRSSHYSREDLALLNNVLTDGLCANCPDTSAWYLSCEKCVNYKMCNDIKCLKCHVLDLIAQRDSEEQKTAK